MSWQTFTTAKISQFTVQRIVMVFLKNFFSVLQKALIFNSCLWGVPLVMVFIKVFVEDVYCRNTTAYCNIVAVSTMLKTSLAHAADGSINI
jgi:hypothetical protein